MMRCKTRRKDTTKIKLKSILRAIGNDSVRDNNKPTKNVYTTEQNVAYYSKCRTRRVDYTVVK